MTRAAVENATLEAASRERDSHHDLKKRITRDSLWLFSGYAVTAGSGFLYWIIAAMVVPQAELGVDASVLSAVAAAAALASSGPGSAMVVMVPASGSSGRRILRYGYVTAIVAAAVLGAIAGGLVSTFLPVSFPPLGTVSLVALFTVIWTLFNFQSSALAAVGEARATLFVNGGANVLKLAIMVTFAITLLSLPHLVLLSTMLPAALAVIVSLVFVIPRGQRREAETVPTRREWTPQLAKTFRRFVWQNSLAVGLVLGVGLSLSFFVTVLSSPSEGAVFAIAYQFGTALDLLGVGVAVSLARGASADFESSSKLAPTFALRLMAAVAALGVAVTLVTPAMFQLLGNAYEPLYGMAVVGAMAFASTLRPLFDVWSAMTRARHRVMPILVSNLAYASLVLVAVFLLVPILGALGASLALVAGSLWLVVVGSIGIARLGRGRGLTTEGR